MAISINYLSDWLTEKIKQWALLAVVYRFN